MSRWLRWKWHKWRTGHHVYRILDDWRLARPAWECTTCRKAFV